MILTYCTIELLFLIVTSGPFCLLFLMVKELLPNFEILQFDTLLT